MEGLSLEEKIASFKKKIDDLGQSALQAPPLNGPEKTTEPAPLYEAPELGDGKIAAMKQRLVHKGLSVSEGLADTAGVAADGGGGESSAVLGSEGSGDDGGAPAGASKAAKLAAEFETGKIAAMKNRLAGGDGGPDGEGGGDGNGASVEADKAARLAAEFEAGKIAAMKNRLVGGDGGTDGEGGGGDSGDPVEADKAAILAAEFETGKIVAMKNRLVSMGLGIDGDSAEATVDPAAAARASHARAKVAAAAAYAASVESKAPGCPPEAGEENGSDDDVLPPASAAASESSVAADPAVAESEPPLAEAGAVAEQPKAASVGPKTPDALIHAEEVGGDLAPDGEGGVDESGAPTEADKAAKRVAESETGNIATMDNRLVSNGRDIIGDSAEAAVEPAAAASVESKAPGCPPDAGEDNGSDDDVPPPTSAAASESSVAADPAVAESEPTLAEAGAVAEQPKAASVGPKTPDALSHAEEVGGDIVPDGEGGVDESGAPTEADQAAKRVAESETGNIATIDNRLVSMGRDIIGDSAEAAVDPAAAASVESKAPGTSSDAGEDNGSDDDVPPPASAAASESSVAADPAVAESEPTLAEAVAVAEQPKAAIVGPKTPDARSHAEEVEGDIAPDGEGGVDDSGAPTEADQAAKRVAESETGNITTMDNRLVSMGRDIIGDSAEAAVEPAAAASVESKAPGTPSDAGEDNGSDDDVPPPASAAASESSVAADPAVAESEPTLAEAVAVAEQPKAASVGPKTPDALSHAEEVGGDIVPDGKGGVDESGAPTEADQAAKRVAESETGNIATIDNRLVSMGRDIIGDSAEAAVDSAAAASVESKAPGTPSEAGEDNGSKDGAPPPASAAASESSVAADPAVAESEPPLAEAVAVAEQPKAAIVGPKTLDTPNIAGEEGLASAATNGGNVTTDPAAAVESQPHDEVVSSEPEVSSTVAAGVSAQDNSTKVDAVASDPGAGDASVPSTATAEEAQAISAPSAAVPSDMVDVDLTAVRTEGDEKEERPAAGGLPPSPTPSSDSQQDAAAPAPTAQAAGGGKFKAPTKSGPSPKIEGLNVAASKAKAALAAAQSRTRNSGSGQEAAAASPGGEARRPRRRESVPDRKTVAPSKKCSGSKSRNASPARKQSPAVPTRGRRQAAHLRSTTSTPVRASPGAGDVSRAIPAIAVTPGLHPQPPESALEASSQPRHTASAAGQKRGSPTAGVVTPTKASRPSAAVMTAASAEASGNRLHEQAKEAMERLERRRTVGGGSPPFLTASPSPFTPTPGTVLTLTPASAEASGNRLHQQAQEARERLERRRTEGAVASLLTAMPGVATFTPRRWSNPRVAPGSAPAVTGVDRIESLYRDAIDRNSRLEMARRAEEEKPRQCTFTPQISKRGRSLVRWTSGDGGGNAGGEAGGSGGDANKGGGLSATFDALYQDAKRLREKMEALKGAHEKVARAPSPVITAMGRQAASTPLDVRMQENAERWIRRRQELEERRIEHEKEGCTFMPKFAMGRRSSSAPRLRPRRSGSSSGIAAFVARSARFLETRERNMMKLKQEAEERERAAATFKPVILPWGGGDDSASAGAGSSVTGGADVFERLLRAAENQEMNKAALKQELLDREREQYNNFEPRLPTRQADGPTAPLDVRIEKSTEEWVKSKELREHRRLQLEAEECTFRPSLGYGGRGSSSSRRSSSVDPRARARLSRPATAAAAAAAPSRRVSSGVGEAAAAAFAAREAAFQESKEQRLETLRKEKKRLELQEATFQPVIGAEGRRASRGGGGGGCLDDGRNSRSTDAATREDLISVALPLERKESVGFKSNGAAPTRSLSATTASRQQEGTNLAPPHVAAAKVGASPPLPQKQDEKVETSTATEAMEQGAKDWCARLRLSVGLDVNELSARLQQLATASSPIGEETEEEEEDGHVPNDALPSASPMEPQLEADELEGQEDKTADGKAAPETETAPEPEPEPEAAEPPKRVEPEAKKPEVGKDSVIVPDKSVGGDDGEEEGPQPDKRKAAVMTTAGGIMTVLSSGADDSAAEETFSGGVSDLEAESPVCRGKEDGEEAVRNGEAAEGQGKQASSRQEEEEEEKKGGQEHDGQEHEEGGNEYSDDAMDHDDASQGAYSNGADSGAEQSSQTTRSLEDFDRAQREIAEKMKSLGL
ncbi:unnamed protein product [Pylaiella littoralis]